MYKSLIEPGLFCYATPQQTVAAGTTVTPEINIGNDADFMLHEIRATKQAIGAILIQLQISDGQLLSNVPVDSRLFAEDDFPVRFPEPIRIPANTNVGVSINNTTAGGLAFQLQLWGIKVDKKNN